MCLIEIIKHNWKVPDDIKKDLLKLSEAVFDAVLKLRETMMVLSYGSAKTLEKAKDVEIAERVVDDLYRELEIKILSSKLDLPALLLLGFGFSCLSPSRCSMIAFPRACPIIGGIAFPTCRY